MALKALDMQTTSTALENGWFWRLPINSGDTFCTSWATAVEACLADSYRHEVPRLLQLQGSSFRLLSSPFSNADPVNLGNYFISHKSDSKKTIIYKRSIEDDSTLTRIWDFELPRTALVLYSKLVKVTESWVFFAPYVYGSLLSFVLGGHDSSLQVIHHPSEEHEAYSHYKFRDAVYQLQPSTTGALHHPSRLKLTRLKETAPGLVEQSSKPISPLKDEDRARTLTQRQKVGFIVSGDVLFISAIEESGNQEATIWVHAYTIGDMIEPSPALHVASHCERVKHKPDSDLKKMKPLMSHSRCGFMPAVVLLLRGETPGLMVLALNKTSLNRLGFCPFSSPLLRRSTKAGPGRGYFNFSLLLPASDTSDRFALVSWNIKGHQSSSSSANIGRVSYFRLRN